MRTDRFHVFKVDNEWRGEAPTYEVRKNAGGTSDDWYEGECVGVFETEAEAQVACAEARDGPLEPISAQVEAPGTPEAENGPTGRKTA